ncbi:hypothetical protein CROQUDRAFT_653359 [Cronartium quercuum f. sp. fusiforme G11]|uniref:FHA domain-containing protein n=1 Tax=Cronartium quercuum f. sp. fusiforme G11 TaxID=708437 RepID=A0A9P6TEH8_9BASI|nr:hypothetical protein CROQUDRAFT_653359 [Cronartium quercuum f. sp. fusiforme G11]
MSLHTQTSNTFTPQQTQPPHLAFPALHLHPLNDTFIPKQIALNPNGSKVKIGRQTNQKTIPNSTNGFFDSKVLSRAHAEVWTEDSKVLIRDVKSSNGTFINGERLSAEGVESEAFELHTDDVVEFGIDIIADDNKSVVHHKVATKVFLVLTAEDAVAASNFYRANAAEAAVNRRTSRPGVFAGGSFDHVLNRLQSELEKSRATGQELSTLNSAMNDIHDTLGGGTGPPPPLPPPYGGRIPPLNHQPQAQQNSVLQSQLSETQTNLNTQIEKMKALEGMMGEQEQLKREVGELRDQLESIRRDSQGGSLKADGYNQEDEHMRGRVSPVAAMLELQERQQTDSTDDDDDDARSLASNDTVTWITSSLSKAHLKPNGLPTPAPAPLPASSTIDPAHLESVMNQNQKLTDRIEAISAHVEETLKMGQSLLEQHRQSNETIELLRNEIENLKQEQAQHKQDSKSTESVEQGILEKVEHKWTDWKEVVENGWKKQQESWEVEKQKLLDIIAEWEEKAARLENVSDEENHHRSSSTNPSSPFHSPSKIKKAKKKKSIIGNHVKALDESVENVSSTIRSPKKVRRRTITHDQSPSRNHLDPVNRLIDEHSDASDATMTRPITTQTSSETIPREENIVSRPTNHDGVGEGRGVGRSLIDVR